MSLSKRLLAFINSKNVSPNAFESNVGVSQGLFAKAIRNNTAIGSDKIRKIFQAYNDLNIHWLITGEGEMILRKEHDYQGNNKLLLSDSDSEKYGLGSVYYEEEINRLNRVIVRQAKKNDNLELEVERLQSLLKEEYE